MTRKKENFLPYSHQWIDKDDIKAVADVLKTDWLTQGPKVLEFEKAVAKYCGAKFGVAVSSGTAALQAAYMAAGIEKGDEVITTPLTFAATANSALHCGGRPVFADIQKEALNIDPEEIKKKITKRTKVIAPVDFVGHPCELDEIKEIADEHKLLIIEDAAHALGARYKGRIVGSSADMTILSFHPVKHITTGEGGMILTNNRGFYEKLRTIRHHGIVKKPEKGAWYYEIESPGFNFRITDFQCALGLSQLKKLNSFIRRRREIVEQYNRAFGQIEEIIVPTEKDYVQSSWHIYPVQFDLSKLTVGRREIFDALRQQGIGVQVHYVPLHLQPLYQKQFGYEKGDFPVAEKYYKRAITLPLFPKMTDQDIKRVIQVVKKLIETYRR